MKRLSVLLLVMPALAGAGEDNLQQIPLLDVDEGRVMTNCSIPASDYDAQSQRLKALTKEGKQTWKDVADYKAAHASLLACVGEAQRKAVAETREFSNKLITALNDGLKATYDVNMLIYTNTQSYQRCQDAPVPKEKSQMVCGKERFIVACAEGVHKRIAAGEETRGDGPWTHVINASDAAFLALSVNLYACLLSQPDRQDLPFTNSKGYPRKV